MNGKNIWFFSCYKTTTGSFSLFHLNVHLFNFSSSEKMQHVAACLRFLWEPCRIAWVPDKSTHFLFAMVDVFVLPPFWTDFLPGSGQSQPFDMFLAMVTTYRVFGLYDKILDDSIACIAQFEEKKSKQKKTWVQLMSNFLFKYCFKLAKW